MIALLTIDGRVFSVMVTSVKRSFRLEEGINAADMQDGTHIRDLKGTYIDYEMGIDPDYAKTSDYDALYEILTAPVDEHTVRLPYGRNSTIEYDAQISSGSDSIVASDGETDTLWGGLVVKFKAKKPQRVAADEAQTTLTVQFKRDTDSTHSNSYVHIEGLLGSVDVYGNWSTNPPRYTLPVIIGEELSITFLDMDGAEMQRATGMSGNTVTAANPTIFFLEYKYETPAGGEGETPEIPIGGGDDGPADLF